MDLQAIFQDGYSLEYDYPYDSRQQVTISIHEIGDLILTSGRIIARDPLREPELDSYFSQTVKPGRYPIILSVANFYPRKEVRIAAAMIRISEKPAVRWEMAVVNNQHPQLNQGEIYGYGVDTGTGCFMDYDAERILDALASPNLAEYEETMKVSQSRAVDLITDALSRYNQEFCDRLNAEMDKNQFEDSPVASWANLRVSDETEANVIAFSTGFGDGGYTSYWGYDATNNLTSLVTDFDLFSPEEVWPYGEG